MSNAMSPHPLPIDLPDDFLSGPRASHSVKSDMPPPPDVEPIDDPNSDSRHTSHRPKGPLDPVIDTIHFASRVCGVAAASMFAIAMLIICQLVFMRYVLNDSTVWQTEAVIFLMIGATLVGLPYVQLLRGHVNVDLLPLYLKRGARMTLAIVTLTLGMAIAAMFAFYGLELVIEAYEGGWLSETIWAVPLWKPFSALPIGFGLLFLQFLADFLSLITRRSTPFDLHKDAS
ncbi:TRAP transporter small permease [Thalassospira australica]|uniref:TRAP transporter small permease n=1 Tax=Thalassospira australica TaxID=1528106 RepID=UPI000519FB8E|nr:TRAP transporter small permease [Thalassospira australica]